MTPREFGHSLFSGLLAEAKQRKTDPNGAIAFIEMCKAGNPTVAKYTPAQEQEFEKGVWQAYQENLTSEPSRN